MCWENSWIVNFYIKPYKKNCKSSINKWKYNQIHSQSPKRCKLKQWESASTLQTGQKNERSQLRRRGCSAGQSTGICHNSLRVFPRAALHLQTRKHVQDTRAGCGVSEWASPTWVTFAWGLFWTKGSQDATGSERTKAKHYLT